jgi:EmrB/QacA subfamily drug resistance transporter
MVGSMTVVLSMTTVNVAFPDIMGAFSIGREKAQLLSSGYFAAMTAGMVLAAWLTSILGERITHAVVLLVFIIGSSMSGLAGTELGLNFGRMLQGVAAGVVQPLTLAITFKVWPPAQRGMAMGLYSMGIVFAPAIGPTLGGIAIEFFNWRYVFFLTLPTAGLAALVGFAFLPTKPVERSIPSFDYLGFVLMCLALFTLMLALSSAPREGWDSNYIVTLFAVGALATVGFVLWEHWYSEPLLNISLFRYSRFSAATVVAFFSGCVFITSTFLIPIFVQQIQGYTPIQAGLLLMPGGLSLLVLFPIAGRVADFIQPHYLIAGALASYCLAFTLFANADVNTSFWTLVFWTMFIRIGLAFSTPVVNATGLRALPSELVNQGSGALSLGRQLGAAFGMNCVVAFMEMRTPFHSDAFTAALSNASVVTDEAISRIKELLSESGVPESALQSGALDYLSKVLYAQANTLGYQDAFIALAVISAIGLIPVFVLSQTR